IFDLTLADKSPEVIELSQPSGYISSKARFNQLVWLSSTVGRHYLISAGCTDNGTRMRYLMGSKENRHPQWNPGHCLDLDVPNPTLKDNAEKFLSRYHSALQAIAVDDTYSSDERAEAQELQSTDIVPMRIAWDSVKKALSQEARSLKRKTEFDDTATKIQEPWLSLILRLVIKVKNEPHGMLTKAETANMSNNHRMLYDFDFERLSRNEQLSKLAEYEVWRQRIGAKHVDYKGLYEETILLRAEAIKKSKKGKSPPPIHTALLDTVIYLTPAKPCQNMSEAQIVSIWEHVLSLLSGDTLNLLS
ncbi:hypothetical protein BGZ65_008113, partial [Modicella reniformis]